MEKPRHLSSRQKARKRAVDVLFESDLRGRSPLATLAERADEATPPIPELTDTLVRGVVDHAREIDERISEALAEGWTLERMPRVDRVVARIATYELLHSDTPHEVAISEALVLATDLSTDDSPAFLNAVLSSIARSAGH